MNHLCAVGIAMTVGRQKVSVVCVQIIPFMESIYDSSAAHGGRGFAGGGSEKRPGF